MPVLFVIHLTVMLKAGITSFIIIISVNICDFFTETLLLVCTLVILYDPSYGSNCLFNVYIVAHIECLLHGIHHVWFSCFLLCCFSLFHLIKYQLDMYVVDIIMLYPKVTCVGVPCNAVLKVSCIDDATDWSTAVMKSLCYTIICV